MADATGPITKDNTLLYRLNLAYESADSFQDFRENERGFVALVLRWNIGPRTQVTFELEYKDAREPVDFGIPAVGNRPAAVPRSFNPNEPGNANDTENLLVGFNWSHAFNDNWSLRHNFYWQRAENLFSGDVTSSALETTPDNRILLDRVFLAPVARGHDTYFSALDLTGKFETWGLTHTLLLGGDYYNNSQTHGDRILAFVFTPIDLFDPVHGGSQGEAFVPEFSGSVWTTYEWQQGLLKGLKLGGGMVARSQREGDNENTFQLPGYAIVNLMTGYQWEVGPSKVSLQINVENLLDKDYFSSSAGGGNIAGAHFGAPRTFLGSVRVEF